MPNLSDPLKTPFISVFNRGGKRVADNFGEGDISVVSLRYKFDDENDDICTIKLQMSDSRSLDILDISRGTELRVVWGYLNNLHSPAATVVVRDMTSKYGNNVIYTDLECTDYLTYLKIFKSEDIETSSVIDYIRSLRYGKYNIKIDDRGKTIYWQYLRSRDDDQKYQEVSKLVRFPDEPNPIDFVRKPVNNITSGQWASDVFPENPVRAYLEKDGISIPTSNRSQYVVLQDLLKKCPNGPWFATGRGNWLLIHNRDLGSEVNREYKYQGGSGQLIDFHAKTKFENFERQSISYVGMDPKDRRNFFVDDYRNSIINQKTIKEILEDKTLSEADKKEELKGFIELYEGGYSRFRTEETRGAFFNPGTKNQYFLPGRFDSPVVKKEVGAFAVRDKTDVDFDTFAPGTKQPDNSGSVTLDELVLRASWFTIPLLSYEEAVNVTNNRERELAQEKEEGKIIVEGDPYLQDQQRVAISNVHSQHEGIYYVKKCEHVLTSQGYKTQLDCLKVVPDATIDTIGTITKEKYVAGELSEDQIEIYKREQLVYGSDVLITADKYIGTRYVARGGQAFSLDPYEKYKGQKIRLSDLYNKNFKYTKDTWVDEALRIYNLSDPKVQSISIDPSSQ